MTDDEIVKIDVQKYIDALDNLIGQDHAYYAGDENVDAIVEIIKIAKNYEYIINHQKVEIKQLSKRSYKLQKSLNQSEDYLNITKAEIEKLNAKIKSLYKELVRIALMTVETESKEMVGD